MRENRFKIFSKKKNLRDKIKLFQIYRKINKKNLYLGENYS